MVDIKEIKKTCPKAYKLLGEWIQKQIEKFQAIMAQNEEGMQVQEIPKVDDKIIEGMLMWNQRQLFSFHDEHKVIVTIGYLSEDRTWDYLVNDEGVSNFKSRPEAEDAGFTKAFVQLEKL